MSKFCSLGLFWRSLLFGESRSPLKMEERTESLGKILDGSSDDRGSGSDCFKFVNLVLTGLSILIGKASQVDRV